MNFFVSLWPQNFIVSSLLMLMSVFPDWNRRKNLGETACFHHYVSFCTIYFFSTDFTGVLSIMPILCNVLLEYI